jgi:hypothetical protein
MNFSRVFSLQVSSHAKPGLGLRPAPGPIEHVHTGKEGHFTPTQHVVFFGAGSRRNAISCHFRLHFPGSRIATSSWEGLQGFIPSCESVQLFPTPHFLSVNFV